MWYARDSTDPFTTLSTTINYHSLICWQVNWHILKSSKWGTPQENVPSVKFCYISVVTVFGKQITFFISSLLIHVYGLFHNLIINC
jgi:hypothetical protein